MPTWIVHDYMSTWAVHDYMSTWAVHDYMSTWAVCVCVTHQKTQPHPPFPVQVLPLAGGQVLARCAGQDGGIVLGGIVQLVGLQLGVHCLSIHPVQDGGGG